MTNSLRAIALTAVLFATAGIATPGSAEAPPVDFGPYYLNAGATIHFGESKGFDDSYGLNLRVGARVSDWFGYEMHYEYIAAFDGATTGTRRTFDRLAIHSLMPMLRFRQKFGFIEPYGLAGLGLIIGDVSTPLNSQRTDLGWGWRVGGGILTSFDFPVNMFAEYSRVFTDGRIKLYDYTSIAIGLEGRF